MPKNTDSTLRIIGGQFRSRHIVFAQEPGLRPTHSRIRETLFNWLAGKIEQSVCLDVFAGSGALGFEALSRGATEVIFCDTSPAVIQALQKNARQFGIENAAFFHTDFLKENKCAGKKFDVVFCDPPFKATLLISTCALLMSRDLLNPGALIYGEFAKNSVNLAELPQNWVVLKHKKTPTLEYVLCENA